MKYKSVRRYCAKGWIETCDLNPGDVIYTKDLDTAVVKSVILIEFDDAVACYSAGNMEEAARGFDEFIPEEKY